MNLSQVIVINDFAHINGGASQVALQSALALAQRKVNVHLFAGVGPTADFLKSTIPCTVLGQHEIALDPDQVRAFRRGIWNPLAYRGLRELLSSHDRETTVVHLHSWMKCLSSSVARATFDAGFPLVVTLHDFMLGCPNAGFYQYPQEKICHLKGLSMACIGTNCDKRSYPQKLWRVGRQIVQNRRGLLPGRVKYAIAVGGLVGDVLAPYLPEGCKTVRIANPVDVPKLPPVNVGDNSAFIFVGRLSPEKGPLLFAEAARRAGITPTFVGDGELADEVRGKYPEARITGWQTKEQVFEAIRSARALVFPSRWYETWGIAVCEALACGVPAIVPDTSAAAEFVVNESNGLIFLSGDADSLAQQMRRLQDAPFARQLGTTAYETYWKDPLTMDQHCDQLLAYYDQILREQGRRGT